MGSPSLGGRTSSDPGLPGVRSDSDDSQKKPPPEIDLHRISDEAQTQFADILRQVPGKKDIVIQPELMSLLEHITPYKFLKQYVKGLGGGGGGGGRFLSSQCYSNQVSHSCYDVAMWIQNSK